MFRGPSGYSQSLHRQTEKAQARSPDARPLTKAEQMIFTSMLQRRPAEGQVAYWKRKKALLGTLDKQGLVKQQQAREAEMAKSQSERPKITVEAYGVSPTLVRTRTAKQPKTRSRQ